MHLRHLFSAPLPLLPLVALCACRGAGAPNGQWTGTIDTLPNGAVAVTNPAEGVWDSASAWRVVEELRLGAMDSEGPEQFGRIMAIEADAWGRIYVLDGQAEEIRVFDGNGRYVRTFARAGAGPGELRRAMTMLFDPQGRLRVLDPANNRISVFDTAGTYLDGVWMAGSWFTTRWPGGYDSAGYFYNMVPNFGEAFGFDLIRYDSALRPVDTIAIPTYEGEYFEYKRPGDLERTDVPFSPFRAWVFDRRGSIYQGINAAYRIAQTTMGGDTLRIIERAYTPAPVTGTDRDSAIADLKWFTDLGGKIDPSRIPGRKPAYAVLLIDRVRNLWVLPYTATVEQDRVVDVFDPVGRYLGRVPLPFKLATSPWPIITNDQLYAVTEDELGVQLVVRARILKGVEGQRSRD